MGYFQVSYESRVVIYDCRAFLRLATDWYLSYCAKIAMSGIKFGVPTLVPHTLNIENESA